MTYEIYEAACEKGRILAGANSVAFLGIDEICQVIAKAFPHKIRNQNIRANFSGYEKFKFQPAAITKAMNFAQWLNESRVQVEQSGVQGSRAENFKLSISSINSIIEGVVPVRDYGQANPNLSYRNISDKFFIDHFAKNKSVAAARAGSRSVDGIRISTSIDIVYADSLNREIALLKRHKLFTNVIEYLCEVRRWNPMNEKVNSICYVGTTVLTAVTHNNISGGEKSLVGRLMFAVQRSRKEPSDFLLHHFEKIIPISSNNISGGVEAVGWEELYICSIFGNILKYKKQTAEDTLRQLDGVRVFYKID